MRPGKSFSLTVTLPNEQRIEIPEAVVVGRGGKSMRWRVLQLSRTLAPGSSITSNDWVEGLFEIADLAGVDG